MEIVNGAVNKAEGGNPPDQSGNPLELHSNKSSSALQERPTSDQAKEPGDLPENRTEDSSAKKEQDDSHPHDLDPAGVPGNTKTLSQEDTDDRPRDLSDSSSNDNQQPSDKSSEEESHAPGTGTKHIKSTGFASQGGNFDAKAPGAGKEAGRLLEEQGENLRRPSKGDEVPTDHEGGLWKGTHKSGLSVAKAKEKLHIGNPHS